MFSKIRILNALGFNVRCTAGSAKTIVTIWRPGQPFNVARLFDDNEEELMVAWFQSIIDGAQAIHAMIDAQMTQNRADFLALSQSLDGGAQIENSVVFRMAALRSLGIESYPTADEMFNVLYAHLDQESTLAVLAALANLAV